MLKIRIALLIAALLSIGSFFGCENINPINPDSADEFTTVGELKSGTSVVTATSKGPRIIAYKVAEIVPGGPSLLNEKEETEAIMVLTHSDEVGGNEHILITMASKYHIPAGSIIRIVVNGEHIGDIVVPKNLTEATVLIEDDDLPDGEATIVVNIVSGGTIAATAEIAIDRPSSTNPSNLLLIDDDDNEEEDEEEDEEDGEDEDDDSTEAPVFESVEPGSRDNEFVMNFSCPTIVNGDIITSLTVIDADGTNLIITGYRGSGTSAVTISVLTDLPAGQLTVRYDGDNGLEGPGGEEVDSFWSTFTVEGQVSDELVWKEVPVGNFTSGIEIRGRISGLNHGISPWLAKVLGTRLFQVAKKKGTMRVGRVRMDDLVNELGIQGPITLEKIRNAVIASDKYGLLTGEAVMVVLMQAGIEIPFGESYVGATEVLYRSVTDWTPCGPALGGGNAAEPRKNGYIVENRSVLDGAYTHVLVQILQ